MSTKGCVKILICREMRQPQSLPQAAKLPVQGKVDSAKNACIVLPKTDEVVPLKGCAYTIVTAGRPTSTDPALPPTHLPLNRSLRSLGKAFGRGSRHSNCLFPFALLSPRQISI